MHPNFYHWHSRAEFKPDTQVLEKRWKVATEAMETIKAPEVQSLLRLVLYPGAAPVFAKKFSEAIVKLEPTFPPEGNAELLRVMATAAVYEQIKPKDPTNTSDAFALGIRAAEFGTKRIQPICKDIIELAHEYLTAESERMRPKVDSSRQDKLEDETKAHLEALKKASEEGDQEKLNSATVEVNSKLVETLGCYRDQWDRHMEESQFLWWLVGRRSSQLRASRQTLTAEQYAFPAAVEAAERVELLPPSPSIEPLLHDVLSQCAPAKRGEAELEEIIEQTDTAWAKGMAKAAQPPELTPVSSLIGAKAAGTKTDPKFWKQLRVPQKMKITPAEASAQYFRELMFLQALDRLT